MERMRAAIRARTQDLGIEKSKVSADYIAERERAAFAVGAAGASEDANRFGGLDLSQISTQVKPTTASQWDENVPSMFYDPEDDLTVEEREEVDPVMKKSILQQGLNELQNAKWPTLGSALREVAIMLVVIVVTAALVISWDKLLRYVYTSVGFIPSAEDLRNYASRFDGLDLPPGWVNNMNDQDVASYSEQVNQITTLPTLPLQSESASTTLPGL
jgi:hypothetical protein